MPLFFRETLYLAVSQISRLTEALFLLGFYDFGLDACAKMGMSAFTGHRGLRYKGQSRYKG